MSLTTWANTANVLPPIDREETTPHALSIIIRQEKNTSTTHEQALEASARLIVEIFASNKLDTDPEWTDAINNWISGRIRKIVRRARAGAWEKLRNTNEIYLNHNGVEVLAFPPHIISEVPPLIRNLQVSGLDLPHTENSGGSNSLTQSLNITVNTHLNMSTGKAMAQVGHAAQLAIMRNDPATLIRWQQLGFPISIVSHAWEDLTHSGLFNSAELITIHDAGFTEIPAGSATCEAFLKI